VVGNLEACFLSGIKSFFIEHKGSNHLRRATEGGHDSAVYLYAILLYRDNGSAAADDTAKGYMRRVAGSGSTRRPRVCSTTRLGAFGVNRCRLRLRCTAISRVQAPVAAALWKKDGFEFLCFAAKTVGCVAKW
jgi:hypothetical protein